MLLGDAVNALVLNDDAAAQTWREKLAGQGTVRLRPAAHRAAHAVAFERRKPTPRASSPPSRSWAISSPSLLEDAHVVDDLAAGWKLKAAQPQSTIATRAGELITRSGLLSSGRKRAHRWPC